MRAAILSIGSELTSGQTVNTNAAYLAQHLQAAGIPCARHLTVPDDHAAIVDAVRDTLASRHELILLTGGLGPTFDDVTAAALAQATDRPLRFVPTAAARVRHFYRQHHRRLNRLALRQAFLPEGAQTLPNPAGTAPGIWLDLGATIIIALPGVPREMRAIVEALVLPRLRRLAGRVPIATRTLRTIGLVELQIQEALRTIRIPASLEVGLYPNLMAVDVRLTVTGQPLKRAHASLNRVKRALRARLGDAVYGQNGQTLEEAIGQGLARKRLTLAVAESCTGGLVSDRLTNVPGSSRYLLLSVVAYHNRAKQDLLGVPHALLKRYGAVSAQAAKAMAQGVRRCAGSDVGLSVTGIAGPTGATPAKPVGLVYMALADGARTVVERHIFHGDRLAVKSQAAQLALNLLRRAER